MLLTLLQQNLAGGTSYTLTADAGSYVIAGQDAGLLSARVLPAASAPVVKAGHQLFAALGSVALGESRDEATATQTGITYAVTGIDAGLFYNKHVVADAGSYALAGQDAGLVRHGRVAADAGSYTLSGQDAALLFGHLVSGATGAYVLTGQSAPLVFGQVLHADAGAYALSGQDVSFALGFALSAGAGSYALSGQDAGGRLTYLLTASPSTAVSAVSHLLFTALGSAALGESRSEATETQTGSTYELIGREAGLYATFRIEAGAGSYDLTGQDALLKFGFGISADIGAYVLSGQGAGLIRHATMTSEAGAYVVSGLASEGTRTKRRLRISARSEMPTAITTRKKAA